MRRPLLVALWIVATAATTAVAYVAVNAAGAEVTDRPLTSVIATGATTTSIAGATVPSPGSTPATTLQGPTSTTALAATTSPTNAVSSTTSSAVITTATSGSTTSTSGSTPASTSTTASEAPWQQSTIPSRGGLVIVSYRPGEVRLESVAPTPGFGYEIDDAGPPDVRVEFEGGDVRVEVRVRWDGGLVIEVDEN